MLEVSRVHIKEKEYAPSKAVHCATNIEHPGAATKEYRLMGEFNLMVSVLFTYLLCCILFGFSPEASKDVAGGHWTLGKTFLLFPLRMNIYVEYGI